MISIASSRAAIAWLLLASLCGLLAGLVSGTSPASAHARYDHSDPADGATLASSPQRVNVWFAQDVRRAGGLPTLIVVNESGDTVSLNAVLDDNDRTHMYADMPPALPPGRYTVIWHTLSDDDGEEAQGAFHFYVGVSGSPTPATTPTAAATTPTATTTATPATPTSGGGDSGVPVWGLVLGVVGGIVLGAGAATAAGRRLR